MNKGYSLKDRALAMLLCVVLVLGMFPAGVVSATGNVELGIIEAISDGLSCDNGGTSAATVHYTYAGTPNWSPKDESIGRNSDGWWVGLKANAPKNVSENATYTSGNSEPMALNEDKWDSDAGAADKYIELWGLIKESYLRSANLTDGLSTYTWKFDWDGNGEFEQTVILDVDADRVVLQDTNGNTVYPKTAQKFGQLEMLSEGAEVTGNGTGNIVVDFNSDITVNWDPMNEAIGRYQDGWWLGMKLNAPDDMTKTELENVNYKSGSNVKSFWTYRDSTGDGEGQYITMWIPLNNLISGNMTPYSYGFDWNDDGLFEQTVTISVDASKVKLVKNGVQEYPVLGVVKSFSGGTITGSGTGSSTVTVDELSVDWSEADESIGRTQGWWAGIWVEAPVGVSAETLKNAKYQVKKGTDADWSSTVKSFWSLKDSADDADVHYIQLWMQLTPDEVKATENITRNYRFNWDGQGEGDAAYEQYVTFTVVPGEDIVLNKQEQAALTFTDTKLIDVWVGTTGYVNEAIGGSGDGKITYAITAGEDYATIDEQTGVLTFKVGKTGKITVTATKAGDTYYKEQTASYTITTVKKVQKVLFAVSNPSDKVYEAGLTFPNPVAEGVEGVPTYSIVSGEDVATVNEETGVLTILKAGTVTVRVDMSETDLYNPSYQTYELTIDKGVNTIAFDGAPSVMTWSAETQPALALKDNLGGEVTWKILSGEEYASVDEKTGAITLLKAGGSFKIQATAAETECYAEKSIETPIAVDHADQNWKGFGDTKTATVTYGDNDNEYNLIVDKTIRTDVTYTVIDGADVADVNADGVVAIKKAGTVVIKANKAGNDQYNPDEDVFTLIIKKAKNGFTFEKTKVPVTYGIESLENPLKNNLSKGAVTYVCGENTIGASVGTDGIVTFADATNPKNSAEITVTVAEDDCYLAHTASYTVIMDYLATDVVPTVTGDKKNDSGWFTGNVKINAPEGYQISYNKDADTGWDTSVPFTTEGHTLSTDVFLKEEATGHITDAISVENIKLDTGAPSDLSISYDTPVWQVVLSEITYGIFKADTLKVTISAIDNSSGIVKLTYNLGTGEDDVVVDINGTAGAASCVFDLPAQYRGKISFRAEDTAGNVSELKEDGRTLVLDTLSPTCEVSYEFAGKSHQEVADEYYTNGNVTYKIALTEANFDLRGLDYLDKDGNALGSKSGLPVVTLDGEVVDLVWSEAGEATSAISDPGDHVLEITFTDVAGNSMETYSKNINIDVDPPEIDVDFKTEEPQEVPKVVDGIDHYRKPLTAEITITEHNFRADDVDLKITSHNLENAEKVELVEYTSYAKNPDNWTRTPNTDIWTLNTSGKDLLGNDFDMVFDAEAIYTFDVSYTDLCGNSAEDYEEYKFLYDKTAKDEDIKIEYFTEIPNEILNALSFGLFKENVRVDITVKDVTSGIEHIELFYKPDENAPASNTDKNTEPYSVVLEVTPNGSTFTATHTIPADARGTVYVEVRDCAGNEASTEELDKPTLVVDNTKPIRVVDYDYVNVVNEATMMDMTTYAEGDEAILYFNAPSTVTFEITEANFDLSLIDEDNMPTVMVNDTPVTVTWSKVSGDSWQAQYTFKDEGDYKITMTYTDPSTNEMVEYESRPLHVDNTPGEIDVTFYEGDPLKKSEPTQTIDGVDYYKTVQTVVVQITEHNFRADDVDLKITAKNLKDGVIGVADYNSYARNRDNWTQDGDVWTLNTSGKDLNGNSMDMVFEGEARYSIDVNYTDLAKKDSDSKHIDFVYDKTADDEDITIKYSTEIPNEILNALSFDLFKENVRVDITVEDVTAGVHTIHLFYKKEDGASSINTNDYDKYLDVTEGNEGTFTATHTIPADARGTVHVEVEDRSGNISSTEKLDKPTLVVDNTEPIRVVDYDYKNVVNEATMMDVTTYAEGDEAILYFNAPSTVTFEITEANFDLSKLTGALPVVTVDNKLDNEKAAVVEGLVWSKVEIEGNNDVWQAQYTFEKEGDYVIAMEYMDPSTNEMVEYESRPLHVDNTPGKIDVTFYEGDPTQKSVPTQTIDGTHYYKTVQTVGVQITEHNFRADDVVLEVTAKDITGRDVDISAKKYADYAKDRDNWEEVETDVWKLKTDGMVFDIEAIYSFKLSYTDLSKNKANYSASFVYDCTAKAEDISITYSQSVFSEVLEGLTFGYYKDDVTVNVTVRDITAGVENIKLTYTLEEGASEVNTKTFSTEPIKATQNADSKDVFTVTYTIPAQAKGRVHADVLDFSGNTSTSDPAREPVLVVDNISPTAEIRYNVPVQTVNGISYYAGNINATISITEANFDSEDVTVTVTRNGANYPVRVTWNDTSVDFHAGSFVLTEDGDYIVNVRYTDKSGNQMADYTSNQLTQDTTAPTIKVSNVKANSANKDETYSFVIEMSDINLDVSSMKPVLKAVVQENGAYKTREIDLGAAATVVAGQTYTYTVTDLPEDGLYTLTCEVKDMSANTTSQIQLEDEKLYDEVQFSINRSGSAFGYGDSFTEGLTNQYYVYSVDEDVVLVEVNVDPIENYTVSLNGTELVEGTDYTSEQTSNAGEWSKRTYRINKSLFEQEGEYSIIVSSTDKATTTAFSDIKNLSMAFVVDQTRPVLTITGLATGGRYQTEAQTVTLIPTDEGGRLKDLKVTVMDSDGQPLTDENGVDISVRFEMAGEEMIQYLADNDGKVTFTVPEGLNNQVRIVCTDSAVNAENETNTYDELFRNVTVSQNQLIIFYANKPLFYGSIAGVLAIAALIVVLLSRKKKSKA